MAIKPMNNALKWLVDMMSLIGGEEITVPTDYRSQVLETKALLENDISGTVNTVLDFATNVSLVKYTIETDNQNLSLKLNDWLEEINEELIGKIPIGVDSLAKEYFKERRKGSSFLLLRSVWGRKDGLILPLKMWFVNGEDITVPKEKEKEPLMLGEESYQLRINKKDVINLPSNPNELIFIQKPYSSWGELFPTPYLIQKGVFKNLKLLQLLELKGEFVIGKALEYLMLIKKGDKDLARMGNPDFIYSKEDLGGIKKDFEEFVSKRKSNPGISTYVTNFDTEMEHIIPDYKKALEGALYEPIEKRILAGLGIIGIAEGVSSDRREGILNPKPFISEIKTGVKDFKALLNDVIRIIVKKNSSHNRYFSDKRKIRIHNSPIVEFLSKDLREHIRSAYDRGSVSRQTYDEMNGLDFNVEVNRRQSELENGLEALMYAQIVQNQEGHISPTEERRMDDLPKKEDKDIKEEDDKEEAPEDRTGPEADNFGSYKDEDFEQAPYNKLNTLPKGVQSSMSKSLQKVWMTVFNSTFERTKSDERSAKAAWSVISRISKKNKEGKWIKINKSSLEKDEQLVIEEILKEV